MNNKGRIVISLRLGESLFVRLHMVTKGQMVDGKACFLIEPLQLTTNSLHGAEVSGEPGGRVGEGDSPGFDGGQKVQATG